MSSIEIGPLGRPINEDDKQTTTERYGLDAMFAPASVAVIGASSRPGTVGRTVLENLLQGGFQGKVYPINAKNPEVLGQKAYPSIRDISGPVDFVVVCTPAATVPELIGECVDAGTKSVVVISAGFRELGAEGIALEKQIQEKLRRSSLRLVGPNCLGIMNPIIGLNATFAKAAPKAGTVAFLGQSGALLTAILDWSQREEVGFSAIVSTGSMLDVGWGDLIYHFGDDSHTKSILIYMESVGDARSFMSAAREVALTKPIIVIKAGRSQAASRAAASHTGALTGSDEVLDAAFRRSGVLRVLNIADLFYMAEVLGKQPRPKGPRLTIVTNAGGPAVLATDALVANGGELADLSPESLRRLDEFLPEHWSHNNPIDVLGDADAERYARALEAAIVGRTIDNLFRSDRILNRFTGRQYPGVDAGQFHVDNERRDALVLRYIRVRSHRGESVTCDVRTARPHLLSVQQPTAFDAGGLRLHARGVQHGHPLAHLGQGHGQAGHDVGLAHAALAGGDGHDPAAEEGVAGRLGAGEGSESVGLVSHGTAWDRSGLAGQLGQGQDEVRQAPAGGHLQVLGDLLAGAQIAQGALDPYQGGEEGAQGAGLVQLREDQARGAQGFEALGDVGEVLGLGGGREHQVHLNVGQLVQEVAELGLHDGILGAVAGGVDEDEGAVLVEAQGALEVLDRQGHVEGDLEDLRVLVKLVHRGDAEGVQGEQGHLLLEFELGVGGELGDGGGLADARGAHQGHLLPRLDAHDGAGRPRGILVKLDHSLFNDGGDAHEENHSSLPAVLPTGFPTCGLPMPTPMEEARYPSRPNQTPSQRFLEL